MKKRIFIAALLALFVVAAGMCVCGCGKNEQVRHEHNYIETVTEPTCLYGGYSTFTCDCGKSYKDKETEKLGHNFDADNRCTRCGYLKHDHDYEKTVVEPTCTEGGYTRGKCKICGATYTSDQTEPLGHNYVGGACTRCNKLNYTEGMKYTLLDDDTYCLSGLGTATDTEIVIPSVYNGKAVTTIDYNLWRSIGYGRNTLSVTIPQSVTGFTSLYDVDYPTIGWDIVEPFWDYEALVIIYAEAESKPESWVEYWNYAKWPVVWDCSNNDVADDGNIYKVIDEIAYAFKDGSAEIKRASLKEIVIPQKVTYKDNSYNVTAIGKYAFSCGAYSYNDKLTSVTIPDSVISIGERAFYFCNELTDIKIGTGVREIGEHAFLYCSNLSNITVTDGNPNYYSEGNCLIETESKTLVLGCKNSVIPDGVKVIGERAFSDNGLREIAIPRSVTTIRRNAFYYCPNLLKIVIPDSVTAIEKSAFTFNTGMTIYCEAAKKPDGWDDDWNIGGSIVVWSCKTNEVAEDGNIYAEIGGLKYALKGSNAKLLRQREDLSGNIVVPESVVYKGIYYSVNRSIENNTFYGCKGITGVIIPDRVISIGESAFYGCKGLTEISLPDSVVSIGYHAFGSCENLKRVNLSDKLKTIGDYAFANSGLTEITIPGSVTVMGNGVFSDCKNLTDITFKGTKTQWRAAVKYSIMWTPASGSNIVHCSDGDITIKGQG